MAKAPPPAPRLLPKLRIRHARHPRPLPRVRPDAGAESRARHPRESVMRSTLICICLIMTALAVAAEEEWPADKLSRTAIARNQETFASLPPFACEMTWSRDPAHFRPVIAILKFNGAARFADWERPGPLGPVDGRVRDVFINAYFAFY